MKDLYSENYKTLMKEIEGDTKKWKDILCSWIGRILLKWSYYPKQSTDQMQSLSETHDVFHRTRTSNLKIPVDPQKNQNYQNNLENKEQTWRYNPLRLQTVLQSYSNQNNMVLT